MKNKKLLIIGAGGHGRCCFDIARSMKVYSEISFLDDNNVGLTVNDCRIVGKIEDMKKLCDVYEYIFIAVGNNFFRKKLIQEVKKIGYKIPVLLSDKAFVSKYANVGEGSVIFPFANVEANAIIGKGCIIAGNAVINHDAVVEDYCLVYSNTVIRPNTIIGEYSRIGSGCVISFGTKLKRESDIMDGSKIEPNDE